mgnify:CR=1 FL=1
MKKEYLENRLLYLLIFSLVIFAFYLCFIGGYGSDEDTLPMIYVFEARLRDGTFISSRFTGNPVPEIGIGFLSYYFGSWAANSFTFLFHLIGIILIYLAFNKKIEMNKFNLFIILCLSSPILFFDNLEPIDYSWAFLFFSIGTYFFSKKIFELAILSFAFCVGCRINFLIFCFAVVYFFEFQEKIDIKKKLMICLNIFIIGGLFYLPVWFFWGFGLDWLTAARPLEQGLFGLFARFSYKTWIAIGLLQSLVIVYFIFKNFKDFKIKKNQLLIILIIINLLIFFYIPAELSYLQPAIIFLYLLLVKEFNKKIIFTLILLNFLNWGFNFQILDIKYRDSSICAGKQALSASFVFKLEPGAIKKFFETRKMINCWITDGNERGKRILEGKSTRIPK